MYKQPIILFGLILPLLSAVALIGTVIYGKSEIEASFEAKKEHYAGFEMTRKTAMGLEKLISDKRPDLTRWIDSMSRQPSSEITTQLRNITANLPPKELQLTASDTPPGNSGMGSLSAQKSTLVRLAFRGSFRTMQKAFLELETKMPQLQLQELKIDPSQNQSSLLNFQVTYTAWEN